MQDSVRVLAKFRWFGYLPLGIQRDGSGWLWLHLHLDEFGVEVWRRKQ